MSFRYCFLSFVSHMYFREIKEEKYAARRAILPMLQAEEDER